MRDFNKSSAFPQRSAGRRWINPAGAPDLPQELRKGCAVAIRLGHSLGRGSGQTDDAVSEALLSLMESLQRYEPGHGTQLSTYAFPGMRGRVLRVLSRERRRRGFEGLSVVDEAQPSHTGPVRDRVDARRLIERTQAELNGRQQGVLDDHYGRGKALQHVADDRGWPRAAAWRSNNQLLRKMRSHAEVETQK